MIAQIGLSRFEDGVAYIGADVRELCVDNEADREIVVRLARSVRDKRRLMLIRKEVVQIS